MRLRYTLVPILTATATMAAAAPANTDLKTYLSGNTLIMVAGDEAPQVVRFRKDGTYDYDTDADGNGYPAHDPRDGKWYIKGRTVCLHMSGAQVADIPDNCYPVEVKPARQGWSGKPSLGGYPTKETWQFELWLANK